MGKDDKEVEKITARLTSEEQERVDYLLKTEKAADKASAFRMVLTERAVEEYKRTIQGEKGGSVSPKEKRDDSEREKSIVPADAKAFIEAELEKRMARVREREVEEREPKRRKEPEVVTTVDTYAELKKLRTEIDNEVKARDDIKTKAREEAAELQRARESANKELLADIDKKLVGIKNAKDTEASDDKALAALRLELKALALKMEKQPTELDDVDKEIQAAKKQAIVSLLRGENRRGIEWNADTLSVMGNIARGFSDNITDYMRSNAQRGEFKDFALTLNSIIMTCKQHGIEVKLSDIMDMVKFSKGATIGVSPPAKEKSFDELLNEIDKEAKRQEKRQPEPEPKVEVDNTGGSEEDDTEEKGSTGKSAAKSATRGTAKGSKRR